MKAFIFITFLAGVSFQAYGHYDVDLTAEGGSSFCGCGWNDDGVYFGRIDGATGKEDPAVGPFAGDMEKGFANCKGYHDAKIKEGVCPKQ